MTAILARALRAVAFLGLGMSATSWAAPTSYHFQDYVNGSCDTRALGINDNGVVVGGLCEEGGSRAFSFRTRPGLGGETIKFIGLPASYGPEYATGVDAKGHVVGYAAADFDAIYPPRAYVTENGRGRTVVGERHSSAAFGISPHGLIAGMLQDTQGSPQRAFQRDRTQAITILGTLGGSQSIGRGVNDAGLEVGESDLTGDGARHAFVWSASGGMGDLGTLGGENSVAYAVNAQGIAVGTCDLHSGSNHACRFHDGLVDDLGTLAPEGVDLGNSIANGINDAGAIVGSSDVPGHYRHAFLYAEGLMTDLNDVVSDMPDGYILIEANAINSIGQIVGTAFYRETNHLRGFVLAPIAVKR